MLSKNYTTYEIFYTTCDKIYPTYGKQIDNIYEFRRQHMTYFTQHMKKLIQHMTTICTAYEKIVQHITNS